VVITALLHPLTSLLIPWKGVLIDKLTGFQLVKKFPIFYETPRLITVFTKLFPTGFPTKTLYTPLLLSIRATCPIHLILIELYYITGNYIIYEYNYESFANTLIHYEVFQEVTDISLLYL
jgi:hypothetical protein